VAGTEQCPIANSETLACDDPLQRALYPMPVVQTLRRASPNVLPHCASGEIRTKSLNTVSAAEPPLGLHQRRQRSPYFVSPSLLSGFVAAGLVAKTSIRLFEHKAE